MSTSDTPNSDNIMCFVKRAINAQETEKMVAYRDAVQAGIEELERQLNAARAELAERKPQPSLDIALNVRHPDCHKAADAFWQYWRKNGVPHKHGYYESTWGAINQALRHVGVISHEWSKPPDEVTGTTYLGDCIAATPESQPSGDEPIPMVKRPSGRTIPDLTKREHVCEWQASIKPKQNVESSGDEQPVKRMVNRFLGWKLPKNFAPDNGIYFTSLGSYEHPDFGRHKYEPTGTNLFTADQAREMIEYMLKEEE